MKKFIVTFNYNGFVFNAKVFIKKQKEAIIYSTQLVENCLGYMFDNKELIFTKEDNGYKLILFSAASKCTKQTFISLDWRIRNEYIDKENSLYINTFSMS